MIRLLLTLNHVFLFLCVSLYLGTGGSLVLFSFPVASNLRVDNYDVTLVPQVLAATEFFATLTKLVLVAAGIMLVAEWKRGQPWVPIVLILSIAAATALALRAISPLNAELAAHVRDPQRLQQVLSEWMGYNRISVALWAVQWAALAAFFGRAFFKLERAL